MTPAQAFDFDKSVMHFGLWLESKKQETEWVPRPKDEHKDQVQRLKHSTVGEILNLYVPFKEQLLPEFDMVLLDSEVDAILSDILIDDPPRW